MELNKVVAQFKDGTIIKGKTNNFFPNKKDFHLNAVGSDAAGAGREQSKVIQINAESLKALFFVKNFKGNKDYDERYSDDLLGSGKKVEVKFIDGEVITGYVMNYSIDRYGFFLIPADLQGNNERIFIIKSSTESITFLESFSRKPMFCT